MYEGTSDEDNILIHEGDRVAKEEEEENEEGDRKSGLRICSFQILDCRS